jgi:hypothetical protein
MNISGNQLIIPVYLTIVDGVKVIHKRSVEPCFMNISGNLLIFIVSLTIVDGVKV